MYYNINNYNLQKDKFKMNKETESIKPMEEEMVDTLIVKCADKINELSNNKEANAFFENIAKENPQFKHLANNVYQYKDYFINVGKQFLMMNHAIGLKRVNDYELTSAPKLIVYSDLKSNGDCVLITKIKDSENNPPIPYKLNSSNISLSSKKNLMNDVELLAKEGIANVGIDDINNWHIVPKSGNIIISDWSTLASFEDDEAKIAYKNRIRKMLDLIY